VPVPPPERTQPFLQDPTLVLGQASWRHSNHDDVVRTRVQAFRQPWLGGPSRHKHQQMYSSLSVILYQRMSTVHKHGQGNQDDGRGLSASPYYLSPNFALAMLVLISPCDPCMCGVLTWCMGDRAPQMV
jgi:hypothetical protein